MTTETKTTTLTATDREMIAEACAMLEVTGTDAVRAHTGAADAAEAYAAMYGEARWYLRELAAILGRLGNDEDDDQDLAATCTVCGGRVGIFIGEGDGWHHWRGEGTLENPVVLFDPGHAAVATWADECYCGKRDCPHARQHERAVEDGAR